MPPAPPRTLVPQARSRPYYDSFAPAEDSAVSSDPSGPIIQTENSTNSDPDNADLPGSQIVATVNGKPILAWDVLSRYSNVLAKARKEMPPEKYQELRTAFIQRDLRHHIERKVLIESLRASVKPENLKMLEEQLETMFEAEVERMKKELKVNTNLELERELQNQGTSLAQLKNAFVNHRMAKEYLGLKARFNRNITREELLEYYQDHLDKYSKPARVKWQQILIKFSRQGGKQQAFEVLEKTIHDFEKGADFGEVAKRYSDGPTANDGGRWDWTQAESLADQRVRRALFEQPVGVIGLPIMGDNSFQLLRVTARQAADRIPFGDVQQKIKNKLQRDASQVAAQKTLKEMIDAADIQTIFDEQPRQSSETPAWSP